VTENPEPAAALEARDISACYGDITVLHEISCTVADGEMVGIIGPNGAGKTTFLRVLSGALPPSRGVLKVHGEELRTFDRRALSQVVAFVPQSLNTFMAFTVAELVAIGRTPYVSGWARLSSPDREVIRSAMAMTDVLALADRSVDELSAGERQRAVIALALAQEPKILFLDEPTAHLDIQHAWSLMEIVHGLNRSRGLTVVFSSHDLNLAAEFCSHLLLLEKGRVAGRGTPSEVVQAAALSRVYGHPLDVVTLGADERRIVVPRRRIGDFTGRDWQQAG
jgi:iron complex transport system ATP-binding protein